MAASEQGTGDFPGKAGGKRHNALGILAQQPLIHSGTHVKSVQRPVRHELRQVMVPRSVLRQQHKVVALTYPLGSPIFVIVANVDFAADNRLDAYFFGCKVEVQGGIEIAVVGNGHGGHAEILGLHAQLIQTDGAVQQAVLGMAV